MLKRIILILLLIANVRAEQVVISEVMFNPAAGKPEYIELWNITVTPLDSSKWRLTAGVDYTFPDFNSGNPQATFIKAFERIVVSSADEATTRAAYPAIPTGVRVFGPWTGLLSDDGEKITLSDKNGVTVTTLDYKDGGLWPKAADAGHSIVLRNENNKIDDWHNWHASRAPGGSPGYAEYPAVVAFSGNPEIGVGSSATIIDFNAQWTYTQPTSDPGTAWRGLGFDDSSWSTGTGLLGFETAQLPAPGIAAQWPQPPEPRPLVYLFRKTFTYNGNPTGATFFIDQIVDDGAYYYLNGQPLGGAGYTPNGIWNATADRTVGDAVLETNVASGPAVGLVNGVNVLTAEGHQAATSSSDFVFGAKLTLSTPSSIVINEVKPGTTGNGFIEFYNTTALAVNLNGYYLSDNPAQLTKFPITSSLVVAANSYATMGFAEAGFTPGATTTIYLTMPNGTTAINAVSAAIPLDGRSLGRNPAGATTWFLFAYTTPGAANGSISDQGFSLRLSETHFDTQGRVDWVELQNTASAPVNTTGLWLASQSDFSDKVMLTGNAPASGYASWNTLFPSDGSGDVTLYLIDASNTVLDVAELQRVVGRDYLQVVYPPVVSSKPTWQTVPEKPWWYSSASHTRDAANSPPIVTDIVINEIMPDPPSDHRNGQFIELHNKGAAPVSLAGWKLRGGVDFDFSPGTSIAPGGYLVIGADTTFLQTANPSATIVGPWSGSLSNNGDLIRVIDQYGNLADEVDFKIGGDWPDLSTGSGSSMELVNPNADNNVPSAWRDSDESNKATWQTYTITGVWSQLNTMGNTTDYKELHLFLVGDSHVALRNLNLRPAAGGANLIPNSGTVIATNGSSANGWLCQGTHWASYMSGSELHLVGDGHGDNRPNRAEIDVTGMNAGANYTLTFDARWVSGKNRLIVQTWDHSFGNTFALPIPNNVGTAGTVNSRFAASPPPQVDYLIHSPAVPKSTDSVKVTARVSSASALTSVQLFKRDDDLDNINPWSSQPMYDDGTNGDAVAGDKIYTATVPPQAGNFRIVQFYVRATAGAVTQDMPKLGATKPALWLVDDRNLSTNIRSQRFIVGRFDRDIFSGNGLTAKHTYHFPRLSNHYAPMVFIHNETDVYYNCEIRKSGSPWTRAGDEGLSRGKWKTPGDRIFRGRQKSTYDNDAEGNNVHNRIARYWLYVLGHPVNENEFVYTTVNFDTQVVREDTEPCDGELPARCFPSGGKGQVFRSDDEWWFDDNWGQSQRNADWSYKSTDTTIRYHTEWMTRSREAEYDYSALIDFFRHVSGSSGLNDTDYRERLNRILDPDLTLMMAAVRGYINDWDSLTLDRGKNGYMYRKPTDGRLMFLHWDSDLAFGNAGGGVTGGIPGWGNYIGKPWNRRTFNYYLSRMLDLTTGANAARSNAWLDAEAASNSVVTINKTFYQSWFTNRQATIINEINQNVGTGGAGNANSVALAVSTPSGTTSANTLTITGTAPASAYNVVVDGHSEAVLTWTNQTTWTLSGILLKLGANNFTVRMLDHLGNTVGSTLAYSYTKTGNAPPAMRLSVSPESLNAAMGETVALDATTSFDPEGTALTYAWSISPGTGFTVTSPSASQRNYVFNTPGIYTITVTGTDGASVQASIVRDITVFNTEDFENFGNNDIAAFWTKQNIENRDNDSPGAWYSVEDVPGRILMQTLSNAARPLVFNSPTYPALLRTLPATANWSLQTELTYDAKRTGSHFTGLQVEINESGTIRRYTFGSEDGANIAVKTGTTSAAFSNLNVPSSFPLNSTSATLRIRRVGANLYFERRVNNVWATILTRALTGGAAASAVNGGIFIATTAAENLRVAFDYVNLSNPTNVSSQLNNLHITEMMYSPRSPDTVEFIELKNTGASAINLLGCKFANGDPFDEFIFPSMTLNPGAFVIVTNNTAAFTARYGTSATIARQWGTTSGLSNTGEQVRLLDSYGNEIHNFAYSSISPWPTTANAQGPSIVVVNTSGDYNLGTNWTASAEPGGSPGWSGTAPDSDGDGQPDSYELMFGTNPNSASSKFAATSYNNSGTYGISFPSVSGRSYRVEYKNELTHSTWQTLQTITATSSSMTFTDPTVPSPVMRFYRVQAL